MWEKQWYRGACALCGALVGVRSGFLSCVYLTCNMTVAGDHAGVAHTADELRRFWETGERSRAPYSGAPVQPWEWRSA